MAGGAAVNVFKFNTDGLPKETLNRHLWFAVFAFGLMGAARGVDEGLITGVFNSSAFKKQVGIDDLGEAALAGIKGNVSSMVQIGSVVGALLYVPIRKIQYHCLRLSPLISSLSYSAFLVCDQIGRVWATRQLCAVWIVGTAIFMGNNGSMAAVYAGRFIAGIGIGETVVVGPVYLSEISPAPIRGLCTCMFTGAVYIGILTAYLANWGAEMNLGESYNRWVILPLFSSSG
jgi:MFS family permease